MSNHARGWGAFDCGRRAKPFLGRALREQRKLPTPLRHSFQGTERASKETSGLPVVLFVAKHGQRPLAENPVGARKTHDQRQQHGEEEGDSEYPRVDAPGKLEHDLHQSP